MAPRIGSNIPSLNIATQISARDTQDVTASRATDATAPRAETPQKTGLLQKTQALLHRLASGTMKNAQKYSMEVTVPASKPGQVGFQDFLVRSSTGVAMTTETLANNAKNKMEQVGKLTLKDLSSQTKVAAAAAAADTDTKGIAVQAAVQEAITAQYELRTAFVQYAQASGNNLTPQIMDCDRKISELMNMAGSLMEAAKKNQDVPTALATQSVSDVMNEMRLDMHGTTSFIGKRVATLLEKMDALETQKETMDPAVFQDELKTLQEHLTVARIRIDSQLRGQTMNENSMDSIIEMTTYDPKVLTAVASSLDAAEARLREFSETNINEEFSRMTESLFTSYNLPETTEDWTELINDFNAPDEADIQDALRLMQKVVTQLQKVPAAVDIADVRGALADMAVDSAVFDEVFSALVDIDYDSPSITRTFQSECEKLLAIAEKTQTSVNPNSYETGDALTTALLSPANLSALIESKLRGLSSDFGLAELAIDANLVDRKVLGQGAVNQVVLCTYESASTGEKVSYVFKNEYDGRRGFFDLFVTRLGYSPDASLLGLNIVATEVAAQIGCEGAIAQSKIGSLDGQFGLFMERAPGASLEEYLHPTEKDGVVQPTFLVNGVRCSLVSLRHRLTDEQQKTFAVNLMQELAKLEWADALSGQTDRHEGNYFFHFDPETTAVKITGIDNDCCFSRELDGLARKGDIDFTEFVAPTVPADVNPARIYGLNQRFKPLVITPEIKEKLLAINAEEYRQSLVGKVDDAAITAAMGRLEAAKAHATTCPVLSNDPHDLARIFESVAMRMTAALPARMAVEARNPATYRAARSELARHNFIARDFYQLQPMFERLASTIRGGGALEVLG